MTTLPDDQEALIESEVQEACDYVNGIYERLIQGHASEEEETLIVAIAAEGLQHGRGAAMAMSLGLVPEAQGQLIPAQAPDHPSQTWVQRPLGASLVSPYHRGARALAQTPSIALLALLLPPGTREPGEPREPPGPGKPGTRKLTVRKMIRGRLYS